MLRIYYGDMESPDYIFNPDVYFNNTYEDEWITDPISAEMIKNIDGSTVVGPRLIDSPYLGPISTERLSGGVKTLILMRFDAEHVFNASACGDNCASWILKIAKDKDLTIRLGYLMNFGREPIEVEVVNTGRIVHSLAELNTEVLDHHLI